MRKEVQVQLKDRNSELQSIFESIPQIAFTAKPDGTLEFVNEHWYEYSADADRISEVADTEFDITSLWQQPSQKVKM